MADEQEMLANDSKGFEENLGVEFTLEELMETENLVEELSDDARNRIAAEVIQGYQDDKNSRSSREARMEQSLALAMQIAEEKDFPFDGCANVIVPIITVAAMQFASRALPAVLRDDAVFKPKVIGSDDGQPAIDPMTGQPQVNPQTGQPVMVGAGAKEAKGQRVCDFQNWQVTEQSPNWVDDTDRALNIVPVTGNVYRKWYWSEGRASSTLITPKNFVVDYYTTDLDKARKTHEYVLYDYEIVEKIRGGEFIDFAFKGTSTADEASESVPDTRDEGHPTVSDSSVPHVMLEQYTRYDLDGDGYSEPYIATVHKGSGKIVRLEANWKKDGVIAERDIEGKIVKLLKLIPEVYFVKWGFIPSPDGSFYDLGFGDILFNLNESINSIVNRLLDAGTLASTSSGFIGRGIKIKGGTLKVNPGEFPVIDTRGGSIRDNFVQIKHPEPSATLFNLLGLLIEMAEKITQTNQIVDGDAAGEMAGITMMQLTEQGLTGFKAIYKRIQRAIKKEGKLLYRLNYLYLDEKVYNRVLGTDSSADFTADGYDIVPVSDASTLTDTQKLSKAAALSAFKDDPRVDGVEVLKRIFDAMGEPESLVLGNPPPQQDPMVEVNKMLVQIEGYKARIKEQEAQMKVQKDMADLMLRQKEAELENRINVIKADLDARERIHKTQLSAAELDIKRANNASSIRKTESEREQINARILQILSDIKLAEQKFAFEVAKTQAEENQKKSIESGEMQEIKNILTQLVSKPDMDMSQAIKPLADAVRSLKSDKDVSVEINELRSMMGNGGMNLDVAPIADAIRSLGEKKESGTKRFVAKRKEDGTLEGEIVTDGVPE